MVLDYLPDRFQVIQHVRPKYACTACNPIPSARYSNGFAVGTLASLA